LMEMGYEVTAIIGYHENIKLVELKMT